MRQRVYPCRGDQATRQRTRQRGIAQCGSRHQQGRAGADARTAGQYMQRRDRRAFAAGADGRGDRDERDDARDPFGPADEGGGASSHAGQRRDHLGGVQNRPAAQRDDSVASPVEISLHPAVRSRSGRVLGHVEKFRGNGRSARTNVCDDTCRLEPAIGDQQRPLQTEQGQFVGQMRQRTFAEYQPRENERGSHVQTPGITSLLHASCDLYCRDRIECLSHV